MTGEPGPALLALIDPDAPPLPRPLCGRENRTPPPVAAGADLAGYTTCAARARPLGQDWFVAPCCAGPCRLDAPFPDEETEDRCAGDVSRTYNSGAGEKFAVMHTETALT